MSAEIIITYPFHPHRSLKLSVIHWPNRETGWVTVRDPKGQTLKVPLWMTSEKAAEITLSKRAEIGIRALVNAAEQLQHHLALTANDEPDARGTEKGTAANASEVAQLSRAGSRANGGRRRVDTKRARGGDGQSHRGRSPKRDEEKGGR